jgi:hypothetical protein
MNQELIQKALDRSKNGDIHLGCANGWGDETEHLYKNLSEARIEGTSTHEYIGRCYSEYTFTVELNGERHRVVYTVDSGD